MPFTGKRIWLVGASEGIGEAVVRRLAVENAILTVSARSADKLAALVGSLPGVGHQALPLDVTDQASIAAAWKHMTEQGAIPDIVLYNAGTYEPMGAQKFELTQVERMVDVNFHGMLRVLSFVLPAFCARNAGHIVLVGSVAGYSGLPNAIGYGASKAAVIHLAENLRVDLARTNIKVQLVSPGFVKTRLTEKNSFEMPFMMEADAAAERITQGMKTGRFEIHFPRRFSMILKTLRLLPYSLYFSLVGRISV